MDFHLSTGIRITAGISFRNRAASSHCADTKQSNEGYKVSAFLRTSVELFGGKFVIE
jgi:hypothetical protein